MGWQVNNSKPAGLLLLNYCTTFIGILAVCSMQQHTKNKFWPIVLDEDKHSAINIQCYSHFRKRYY